LEFSNQNTLGLVTSFSLKNKRCNVYINVTLRRIRATTVAMEKQYVLHILSVHL